MGQKTHPIGYRIGYNYTWSSRWYADKDYARLLHQDIKIRKMVKAKLYHAGVSKVEIERSRGSDEGDYPHRSSWHYYRSQGS